MSLSLPPPHEPFVNPETGQVSDIWYRWLTRVNRGKDVWEDLYLPEGGTINWDSGDAILIQADNTVALTGADFKVSEGSLGVGNSAAASVGIEIGDRSGTATTPYIDFHSGATSVDYDVRVIASGGTGVAGEGALTITSDNLSLIGGQVTFPATARPSSNANTLDDYEEGTWVPVFLPSSGSFTTVTYDANTWGRYTKIGREVHFRARMATTAFTVGTGAGNLVVSGLPFAAADLSGLSSGFQSCVVGFRSGFSATPPHTMLMDEAQIYGELFHESTATAASANCPAATTMSNAILFYIGGSYQVSD